MFEPTRRENTAEYPFPILPVHWGPREEGFTAYAGLPSMRWCHAHPTWTHWSSPFWINLLLLRATVTLHPGTTVKLWQLSATGTDIRQLLPAGDNGRYTRAATFEKWMYSDEPMMNVLLWMADAKKAWCKFDLEPYTFMTGPELGKTTYADPKWYPDGLPLAFISAHNTKNTKETDLLLTLLVRCMAPGAQVHCPIDSSERRASNSRCAYGKLKEDEERLVLFPKREDYVNATSSNCCCLHPRQDHPFFWGGKWYRTAEEVPETAEGGHKSPRRCLLV